MRFGAALLTSTLFSCIYSNQANADFYDPPATLPVENGALIRQEPAKLATIRVGDETIFFDGVGTRVMYRSSDELGAPVAVTGTYIEPNTPWKGSGARPLVVYGVGTQGIGDAAAPSRTLAAGVSLEGTHVGLNYEILGINGLVARGAAVLVTDYLGLGSTDRVHTYIERLDLGHAMLDGARAALALPDTSLSPATPIGFYGYSEGGSASGAASELAATYAPELNLKAAYVGAPAADLASVLDTIDGTALSGVIGWAINGVYGYYPEVEKHLHSFLNPAGEYWLGSNANETLTDTILYHGFQPTRLYTKNGQSALEVVKSNPDILAVLDKQSLGRVKPDIPLLVLTGTHDDAVGHGQARQVAVDWCALGADVTYWPVQQLIPATGIPLNHLLPIFADADRAEDWLLDRLQGLPAESNCATIAQLP